MNQETINFKYTSKQYLYLVLCNMFRLLRKPSSRTGIKTFEENEHLHTAHYYSKTIEIWILKKSLNVFEFYQLKLY